MGPVIYVDIETSGGSPSNSRIIEVGAIRVEDGHVEEEYRSFVNPGTSLPYWITSITGIHDEDVVHAPSFTDIAYQLHTLMSGATFIAHNVRFDYSFLKREFELAGYAFKPRLLCTVRLSRALYPNASGHSLEKIIHRHGITVAQRHRALDDARAIKAFAELAYAEHGTDAFLQATALQLKTQTLPPNIKPADTQQLKNVPGVYVFEDEAGRPLYIGKSKQLRTRVLSHFARDSQDVKELKISQQAHRIRTIQTASELEALLLESKLVKELLPIHNRQLRRQAQCAVLMKTYDNSGYARMQTEIFSAPPLDRLGDVYGVYSSRAKAKNALEDKLRTFELCSKLLGLEKTDRACFLHQLGKCHGACIGKELATSYNHRLEAAMQRSRIASWPYQSAVSLYENEHARLVVDKWAVIGRIVQRGKRHAFEAVPAAFDMDTYRILRAYITRHAHTALVRPFAADASLT